MRALSKFSIVFILLSVLHVLASAQTERSKDFNESWSGIKDVVVNHRHGPLTITPYSGTDVKLEAHIVVHAKEAADAQLFIDHFEIRIRTISQRLELETVFNTKSWTTSNNNTKIKFADGSKASGIRNIEIQYTLFVPALNSLEASNKYSNIDITSNFYGDLAIRQYDAAVNIKDLAGKLDLSLKYGKASIGTATDVTMNIYDSKVNMTKARDVQLKCKYSNMHLGHIDSGNIESFDGFCKIESVAGDVQIADKYSRYEIGPAGTVSTTMHDGKITLEKANRYTSTSKYTSVDLIEIDVVELNSTFDDNFNIGSVNEFNCTESKYSSFEIKSLSGKATLLSSYDDEFIVSSIDPAFSDFEIDCKYSTVRLPLNTLAGYTIDAKMKYGKLSYPKPSERVMHKEVNEQLELRAQIGDANAEAKVIINGYDSNIKLN